MTRIAFASTVASLFFISSAFAQPTIVDRLYEEFFSMHLVNQWTDLSNEELPHGFVDPSLPIIHNNWITGVHLKGSDAVVIFVFEKPRLNSTGTFCRSRLNIDIIFEYDTKTMYRALPKASIEAFKEFVSFDKLNVENNCESTSLKDLENYVVVNDALVDGELFKLWKVFQRKTGCSAENQITLEEIGISRVGSQARDNRYYLQVGRNGDSEIIELDMDKDQTTTTCNEKN